MPDKTLILVINKENPNDIDSKIISLISLKPLSVPTISFILGEKSRTICMALRRLERWGCCTPVTKKYVWFWKVRKTFASKVLEKK
jgi:hypothetical protein